MMSSFMTTTVSAAATTLVNGGNSTGHTPASTAAWTSFKDLASSVQENKLLVGASFVAGMATSAGAYLLWKRVLQPYVIPVCQTCSNRSRGSGLDVSMSRTLCDLSDSDLPSASNCSTFALEGKKDKYANELLPAAADAAAADGDDDDDDDDDDFEYDVYYEACEEYVLDE